MTTGSGNDAITAGNLSDEIHTGLGNDVIDMGKVAAGGLDVAFGDDGVDTLSVDASSDRAGISVFPGGSPTFTLRSASQRFAADAFSIERVDITGGTAGDLLNGGDSNDAFNGGGGADTIRGGGDNDVLTGGLGADRFIYLSVADSKAADPDRITDFGGADRIDLSAIDAKDSVDGNDAFKFIGVAHFHSREGELRYAGSKVYGDTDGDAIADFVIIVPSDTALNRGDFVL